MCNIKWHTYHYVLFSLQQQEQSIFYISPKSGLSTERTTRCCFIHMPICCTFVLLHKMVLKLERFSPVHWVNNTLIPWCLADLKCTIELIHGMLSSKPRAYVTHISLANFANVLSYPSGHNHDIFVYLIIRICCCSQRWCGCHRIPA